jgi:hypothetical protein
MAVASVEEALASPVTGFGVSPGPEKAGRFQNQAGFSEIGEAFPSA